MTGTVAPATRQDTNSAVIDALLSASRAMITLATRSLAEVDVEVTLSQFRSLVVLVSHGPQRVVDLARELGVQPSTATRMCDRLGSKGLAARSERPEDRRAAWVTLTPAGAQLVGQVMRQRREEIAKLVRTLDIEEPDAFVAGLLAFVSAAGELPDADWWQHLE